MKRSILVWSCCVSLGMTACGPHHPGGDTGAPDGGSTEDGGSGTPDAGPPPPAPISVTGKVTLRAGAADTNATVFIPGNNRQAQAVDSTGAFTLSGVTPPYDLYVARKDLGSAVVFKGLTLTSPSVTVPDNVAQTRSHIVGTVTGRQTTSDTNNTKVTFYCADGVSSVRTDSAGTYSFDAYWNGRAPSEKGTLFALQSKASSTIGAPTGYLAYGRRDDVTVQANGTLSGQDIAMSPVTSSSLAGSATLPSGYTLASVEVDMYPDAATKLLLFYDFSPNGTFSYAVPNISQTTFTMNVTANGENPDNAGNVPSTIFFKSGLTAGTNNLALALQTAARPTLPANDAKDVTRTTPFSWSPFAQGMHGITFQAGATVTPPYLVTVYQSGTQATLPDLSPLGMPTPASTAFTWSVSGFAPVTSVDALMDYIRRDTQPADASSSVSETRAFTTAAAP